jgi:uncharacterized protein YbaR (Trm112 family)
MSENSSNSLSPDLVELLRCPLTKSRLRLDGDWLVAEVGGLAYPVRDGIPVMLVEEARLPAGFKSLDELKASLANKLRR